MAAWFPDEFGFCELKSPVETKAGFSFDETENILISKHNQRRFNVGRFECLSLRELRIRLGSSEVATNNSSEQGISFQHIVGDARSLHMSEENAGAVFQVASQVNCLEMVGPDVRPEDGITRYAKDKTQGPVCAMACPAGTVFRNYFVDGTGQTLGRQINTLRDVENLLDNKRHNYWKVRNGYVLPSHRGSMDDVAQRLKHVGDEARMRMAVGIQWSTETACPRRHVGKPDRVSDGGGRRRLWQPKPVDRGRH